MAISNSLQVTEPTKGEQRAQELLKEATAKHDRKDFFGAIACLKEAYGLSRQSSVIHPAETYLRLPLYLQKAGRFDDAMKEFGALLDVISGRVLQEFDHQDATIQLSLIAMNRHIIYDKMRVACKREKKTKLVAVYGLLSLASWCEGLHYQERKSELRLAKSKTSWRELIRQLFASRDLNILRNTALDECWIFSEACTEEAFQTLAKKLGAILA